MLETDIYLYYLEYKDGNSNKFWSIEKDEATLTCKVSWGKIGNKGWSTSYGSFATPATLQSFVENKVDKKIAEGYVIIKTAATSGQKQRTTIDDEVDLRYVLDLNYDYSD